MALVVKSDTLEIGVRSARSITLYCLSMADEVKFTSVIANAFYKFNELNKKEPLPIAESKDPDDVVDFMQELESDDFFSAEAVSFIITTIQDNLTDILKMICEEEVTLNDLTNEQFADLCEKIYEMNFVGALGKLQSLWKKIKSILPQTKQ